MADRPYIRAAWDGADDTPGAKEAYFQKFSEFVNTRLLFASGEVLEAINADGYYFRDNRATGWVATKFRRENRIALAQIQQDPRASRHTAPQHVWRSLDYERQQQLGDG